MLTGDLKRLHYRIGYNCRYKSLVENSCGASLHGLDEPQELRVDSQVMTHDVVSKR